MIVDYCVRDWECEHKVQAVTRFLKIIRNKINHVNWKISMQIKFDLEVGPLSL